MSATIKLTEEPKNVQTKIQHRKERKRRLFLPQRLSLNRCHAAFIKRVHVHDQTATFGTRRGRRGLGMKTTRRIIIGIIALTAVFNAVIVVYMIYKLITS